MKKTMLDFLNEVSIEEGYTGWYHVYSSNDPDYIDLNDIPQKAGKRYSDQFKPKWISVGERLPEIHTPCLSYSPNMGRATIDQYREYPIGKVSFAFKNVTYWMPLPEPPKQ